MNLTQEQLAVINSTHPRIIVQANPGSGKSSTLVARVLADQKRGIPASAQYVITYTVAAAEELRSRMGELAPAFIGTTHAFCLMIVRCFGSALGYNIGDVNVIDEGESLELMKSIAKRLNIKTIDKSLIGTSDQGSGQQIAAKIHLEELRRSSTVDFQTMQHEAVRLFERDRVDLDIQGLYVDEAQDTSDLEALLYDLIKSRVKVVFGDINQSIFAWRGATGALMEHGFVNSLTNERLVLTVNHRSRKRVIDAANNLRKGLSGYDNIAAPYDGSDGIVASANGDNNMGQNLRCMDLAMQTIESGQSLSILCRLNQQVDVIREAFLDCYLFRDFIKPQEIVDGKDRRQAMEALAFLDGSNRELDVVDDEDAQAARHLYQSGEINIHTALRALRLTPRQIRIAEVATEGGKRGATDAILALMEDATTPSSKFHIGTIHSAKGREWDHVIVCGCDAEQWEDKSRDELDQRRLFYVATTRAKIGVTYLHTTGKPSKFVKEALGIP
jgi:DNA helicase-2/ATP-dependent DNA helicase PcrA